MFILENVTCGDRTLVIDGIIPGTTSIIVDIIKIAIPVILIVLGLLDLGKAVMANEEKEMKEAQGKFIKRCIYAVLVFFVVAIVEFLFSALGDATANGGDSVKGTHTCVDCFINNNCNSVTTETK